LGEVGVQEADLIHGIPNPDRPKEIIHRIQVRDEAVATSGNL